MIKKQNKELIANSKYCNEALTLYSLGIIDLPILTELKSEYLQSSQMQQELLDSKSELALNYYTNGLWLLNDIRHSNARIRQIVVFFFWVTIVGWIVSLLIYIFS